MLFFVQKKKSTIWKFIPIVLLAACTVLFGAFSSKLSDDNTKKKQEHAGTRPHTKYHTVLCS